MGHKYSDVRVRVLFELSSGWERSKVGNKQSEKQAKSKWVLHRMQRGGWVGTVGIPLGTKSKTRIIRLGGN